MTRFHRTELLLGPVAAEKVRKASVTVAGLGAVGSFAVEALARAGVGHFRLVDFDVIRESNINRQIFALNSTLGRPKVEAARDRILDIHPDCRVETWRAFVDEENVHRLLPDESGVLIDAIDSVGPKVTLLAAAYHKGLGAIISSMGAATRTNPMDIRVGDLFETQNCPLARLMRKRLRKHKVASGIRCIYSMELPKRHAVRPPQEAQETATLERGRSRNTLGSLPYMTGIFGLMAAREAIESIAGPGEEEGHDS